VIAAPKLHELEGAVVKLCQRALAVMPPDDEADHGWTLLENLDPDAMAAWGQAMITRGIVSLQVRIVILSMAVLHDEGRADERPEWLRPGARPLTLQELEHVVLALENNSTN
jgi:hypothetical protein